jgi:hypothetical protein
MKKSKLSTYLISAAAALGGFAFWAHAEMELVELPPVTGLNTNTTVTVTSAGRHNGIIRYIYIDGLNTGTVAIATVSGYGASRGGARTILASASRIDLQTNMSDTVYLGEDFIRATCSNAATNSATYRIGLIIDK